MGIPLMSLKKVLSNDNGRSATNTRYISCHGVYQSWDIIQPLSLMYINYLMLVLKEDNQTPNSCDKQPHQTKTHKQINISESTKLITILYKVLCTFFIMC